MPTTENQDQGAPLVDPDAAWAILPSALETLARGQSPKLLDSDAAFEAFVSRSHLSPAEGTFRAGIRDGVGVLPIFGTIRSRSQWIQLAYDLEMLMASSEVHAVVLDVDGPGGIVAGAQEFAEVVASYRGHKPVISFIAGVGASAHYWAAVGADEVVMSPTAEAGGLGVVIGMWDDSKLDERIGIRRIEVVSSQTPLKRKPPSDDDGMALAQRRVDDVATVMLQSIAELRGVSVDKVLKDYGQGDLLVGERAVSAGLADRLGRFEPLLAELSNTGNQRSFNMPGEKQGSAPAPGFYAVNEAGEMQAVNFDAEFVARTPALKAVIDAEVEAALAKASETASTQTEAAVEKERARIAGINDICQPGFEAQATAAISEGKTAEAFALEMAKALKENGTSLQALKGEGESVPRGGSRDEGAGKPQASSLWGQVVGKFGGK